MDTVSNKINLTENNDLKELNDSIWQNCGSKCVGESLLKCSQSPSYSSFNPISQKLNWLPYNSFMSSYSDRMNSFKKWPKQMSQTPEELSLSGFYYRSEGDYVHCFYCGIGLHDWGKNDSVHFEHRKHAPFCKYLTMISEY